MKTSFLQALGATSLVLVMTVGVGYAKKTMTTESQPMKSMPKMAVPAKPAEAVKAEPLKMAKADLKNAKGESVGSVSLTETANGVILQTDLMGIAEGWHGFHAHAVGECKAPDFKTAGGHFMTGKETHGLIPAGQPHLGDMPNIYAGKDGKIKVQIFNERISLKKDSPMSVFDKDGSTLVIHVAADDYKSQPSGDSGNRFACGVIQAADSDMPNNAAVK